jgi:aspartyl-tRNA(Asn)/glutamyl-tRNA(Gln) amidotransferase subunit A
LLRALKTVDVLLTPTTPSTAFKLGEKVDDPVAMYLSDIFTVPANLAGVPALSVPWGNDSKGLPIGLQLMATHFEEEKLLSIGATIEQLRSATI